MNKPGVYEIRMDYVGVDDLAAHTLPQLAEHLGHRLVKDLGGTHRQNGNINRLTGARWVLEFQSGRWHRIEVDVCWQSRYMHVDIERRSQAVCEDFARLVWRVVWSYLDSYGIVDKGEGNGEPRVRRYPTIAEPGWQVQEMIDIRMDALRKGKRAAEGKRRRRIKI